MPIKFSGYEKFPLFNALVFPACVFEAFGWRIVISWVPPSKRPLKFSCSRKET
jgi:hypothetical protein